MQMDLYRAGEAMLRSTQPILPFLAPAAYRLSQTSRTAAATAPVARYCKGTRITSRAFSTTHCRKQQQQDDSPPPGFPSTTPSSQPASQPAGSFDMASLLDSTLDLKKGRPAALTSRTSRTPSPNAQRHNAPPSQDVQAITKELEAARPKGRTIVENLLSSFTRLPNRGRSKYGSNDITRMLDASGDRQGIIPAIKPKEEEPVELPKNVGRMIEVNDQRNMDVGRAFRTLEQTCARNRVKRDARAQRFHERPGLKRKRLKRERWARRFKFNFVQTVQLIQRMNKQGW